MGGSNNFFENDKMENAKVKLTYFNLRGRAESIRMLLTLVGKEFEDVRINQEEWAKMKPSTPLGQLPVVEINSKTYPQSVAVVNYLARQYGLYGKTPEDQFRIELIMQTFLDFIPIWAKAYFAPSDKEELLKKVGENDMPRFLSYVEGVMKESGTGYVYGNSLSLGDIIVYDMMTGVLKSLTGHVDLKPYPSIKQNMDKLEKNETMKKYLDSRPDTPY